MRLKSQSSLEFLLLAGFMFFFFIIMITIIGGKMIEYQGARNEKTVRDIMDVVRTEILLADTSVDGYRRYFTLPETINGNDYEMGLITLGNENNFIVLFEGKRYDAFFPGKIQEGSTVYKGPNYVTKNLGVIDIDSNDPCKEMLDGENQYCIGGSCYCFPGFYDKYCNEPENGYPDDNVYEDDFVVPQCGGFYEGENHDPIDCVAVDPCNNPPKFVDPMPYIIPGSEGETDVMINFTSNEDVTVHILYIPADDTEICDPKLQTDFPVTGTFRANKQSTVHLTGLKPDTEFCWGVVITDRKGKFSSYNQGNNFLTTPDVTVPVIDSKDLVFSNPVDSETAYLDSIIKYYFNLIEPSGFEPGDTLIFVNRTDSSGGNLYQIGEYPLSDDYAKPLDNKTFGRWFRIEGEAGISGFFDPNASTPYNPTLHTFYNSFDGGNYDADFSDGPGNEIHGAPEIVSPDTARFGKGVRIMSEDLDCLKYEVSHDTGYNIPSSKRGSIEFWLKPEWDGDNTEMAYLFDIDSINTKLSILKLGTKLRFIASDSASGIEADQDITSWSHTKWYFIAATWDLDNNPVDNFIALYVNGTEAKTPNPGFQFQDIMGGQFVIGCNAGLINPAKAVFDHFVVSKEPLLLNEIIDDMTTYSYYSIDLWARDASSAHNEVYSPQVLKFEVNYTDAP